MEDNLIVDLYWQRNERSISETATKYGKYLHSISYQILQNAEDAEECVNDTYNDPKYNFILFYLVIYCSNSEIVASNSTSGKDDIIMLFCSSVIVLANFINLKFLKYTKSST